MPNASLTRNKGAVMENPYVIERPVNPRPLEKKREEHHLTKYPFQDMWVGDSFFVPDGGPARDSMMGCANHFARKYAKGWLFCTKKIPGGYRVYRVA